MGADYDDARQRLIAMREELQALSAAAKEDRSTVGLDQQSVGRLSRMDALQRQAMAQATERQRARDLQRIDAALRRIEEDDYGYCADCGEAIADKRLEVDPMAERCVHCAGR